LIHHRSLWQLGETYVLYELYFLLHTHADHLPPNHYKDNKKGICASYTYYIPKLYAGLDVATCGVANATSFYPVATKFSRQVANLDPKIGDFLLWGNVH